jgi:hypothetical protein
MFNEVEVTWTAHGRLCFVMHCYNNNNNNNNNHNNNNNNNNNNKACENKLK